MKLASSNLLARRRHRGAAAADRHSRLHLDHAADLPHVPVRDLAEGRRVLRQVLARSSDAAQFRTSCFTSSTISCGISGSSSAIRLVIAVAVGALTLLIATAAAFAISRLRVPGGRGDESGAVHLFHSGGVPRGTDVPHHGQLRPAQHHWALILAMVTIASPYAIWVLKQASDKLPVELDEAAIMDGATTLQLFRLVYCR